MKLQSKTATSGHDVYSASMRLDILPLFDRKYSQVLDVGCSTGNTGVLLKARKLCDFVTGVEPFEATATIAKQGLDRVIEGSIENAIHEISDESMDCVLCLDVLEHLVDPWRVIDELGRKVKVGGVLICSLPNIRHVSILFNLLVLGKWTYTESGILDRTHLRFFTRGSTHSLVAIEGFEVEEMKGNLGLKSRILNYLTLGILRDFLIGQHQTRSRKVAQWRATHV